MIIKNGTVVTPFALLNNTDVREENGIITQIGENLPARSGEQMMDASGRYVCPGFVDIHTHGGGGGDFMDAEEDAFERALRFHCAGGTTSVLASSVTAPVGQILQMLSVVRHFKDKALPVCRVLGAHLEGPYLSVKNKGAQQERYLLSPDRDDYSFITDNRDIVVNVTLSPELPGAAAMTRALTAGGIVVSGGHDDGCREAILPAVDAGLSNLTHLFCAMSAVSMRDGVRSVGLTELGLLDDRLTAELIADNHHLPPELVRLAYRCKGAAGACVVSDCLRAGGMPKDGALYTLGARRDESAQKFIVADGVASLPDGSRFAGSIQPLGQMVRNLVYDCNIPLVDAIRMASHTPARIIRKEHLVGSVQTGRLADFCLLDPALRATQTIVGGRTVWRA